ncbi:MAG: ComEC/Rec2 family competence protein [Defluviimonas sp.]|uniref:ComEC/Rec2 family competence protein n=1 Tax=Albidovulum sp. TaxID=1872424 RepID=UPI001D573DA9|nr:ComEC/Rec2 family competence protein [Paracoccaceae bacterium]MCC0064291.1 ComEC/Rec2 family competence protein [Defluviimonas sp.]
MSALPQALAAARGQLLPWAPVFLAIGIGSYFAWPTEPSPALLRAAGVVAAASCAVALAALRLPGALVWRAPAAACGLIAFGLLVATLRANLVAAPVLPFRYYGPVEGRIIDIDRSFSDRLRLTLDDVAMDGMRRDPAPAEVRVALHGEAAPETLAPGARVRLVAHMTPPDGPVAPGGFDFQRLAWFEGLGAVGYSRNPPELVAPPEGGAKLAVFRTRMALSHGLQARIPGQAGAFAAAVLTGDRAGLSRETTDALRGANLSHLIAISGLHMGLLTGFVFAALRHGLALFPAFAMRIPAKKIAALVALAAAVLYLLLAGPSVATRRAFIMAAVMLGAVLADRRAISFRSVAIAALILLVVEPESLVEPGFQMSFGATIALIAVFRSWTGFARRLPRLARPVAMLVVSSATAGLATAPIAAAHFNRIAEYGLLANLVAVPLMGTFVMPLGVVAALLAPLGLAQPAIWALGQATALILAVAAWISGLDGAVVAVPAPPVAVLPLLALGGLLIVATGARRPLVGAGAALVVAGFALWAGASRPTLLVAGDGTLAGLMTEAGRALSKPKGAGFVASAWLEDDGDAVAQDAAALRPGFTTGDRVWRARLGGQPVVIVTGKGARARARPECRDGAVLVLTEPWDVGSTACDVYDSRRLRETGALAIDAGPSGLVVVTARGAAGARLWNTPGLRRSQ